ncbi:MAG: ABC transporter permease [Pseudoflavonifractor sp.]|nr:ABC transporter permease [Pseudoflavonifractor sp.]
MNIELFIARRIRLKDTRSRTASPSVLIAVTGISLAVAVMILSICVVLGFKHEIRDKVMGFDAHIIVTATDGYGDGISHDLIDCSPTLMSIVRSAVPDASVTITLDQPGILKTADNFMGVVVRGMSPDGDWTFVRENITDGSLPDYSTSDTLRNSVVISAPMASALDLGVGDNVHAYFFTDNNVRARRLTVAAIYNTHFSDYDNVYLFAPSALTQSLNGATPSEGSRIELRLPVVDNIDEATESLRQVLANACYDGTLDKLYSVDNVYHTGMMYFNWIALLDTNVIVILILMSLVSGFTLVSCLFIIILERVNMIGILKALGATDSQVRRTFIYVAERIVIRGLLIGNLIALTIVVLQSQLHLLPLDPDAYYLNYVPVEIDWWSILLLNIGVIILSGLMLVLPSQMISRISPAQSIRYE